jgi:photosystem II stability/assembly factor-like uncharacterized protein
MAIQTFAMACLLALSASTQAGGDPLDTPARPSQLAAQGLITALDRAGDTLIAVGQRGHVLRSTDGGTHWEQAKVPVSSDLTAVQFVSAKVGFAVGHDGVVLRSDDAGQSWKRVLDGRTANQLAADQLKARLPSPSNAVEQRLLQDAQRNLELGPDKPLLDLWFSNAQQGFVVGAYNMIFHTDDGGQSWQSWSDRTDNPKQLSFYAIRPAAGGVYIAGEAGLLLKLDGAKRRFRALTCEYTGTWFGLLDTGTQVVAYGMRGHAYASTDGGAHWKPLATGLNASITAGDADGKGSLLLADLAGNVASSRDGGVHFITQTVSPPMPLSAALRQGQGVVLGGPRGLRFMALTKDQ